MFDPLASKVAPLICDYKTRMTEKSVYSDIKAIHLELTQFIAIAYPRD